MFKQLSSGSLRLTGLRSPLIAPINLITKPNIIKSIPLKPLILTPLLHRPTFINTFKNYSTATRTPPPQPPKDKNIKGKQILNRISRAFTFSLSTVIVILASGVAILVVYLILSELLLPSGDTRTFNKAVNIIENSPKAQSLLGFPQGERLKAYGIVAADKWIRNRSVQSMKRKSTVDDKDHLFMKFQVETSNGKYGVVSLEQLDYTLFKTKFEYIALDVPGEARVYIVEPEGLLRKQLMGSTNLRSGSGFLGLNWGPKKD
ncbi:TIM21 [Candida jiufengensis]|uniref:TIM21 n=1 Tax=Candida jiufengensis TaxID=497108 RepID=UPI0022252726|nr:TIM21 [Candida jiufengensis]KAI5953301.1 TIM21 [Candida jiufengensis]